MIYPSSTANPKWEYEASGSRSSGDRYSIGGRACDGEPDHGAATSRGYMCGPNDWRSVEQKVYFNGSTGGDALTLYQGGGRHSDSCPCCGFAHKMSFQSSGNVELRKETWHVNYDDMEETSVGSLSGGNVGVAFCRYWTGTDGVRCEAWTDPNMSNSWSMVLAADDAPGRYPGGGGRCNGPDAQPGRWGFPAVVFRTDDFGYSFQHMSAREIDPGGSFTPGTPGGTPPPTTPGPGGGTGAPPTGGGQGDGGGGSGGDNNTGTAQAFAGNGCAIAIAGGVIAQAGKCQSETGTGADDIPAAGEVTVPSAPTVTVYKDLGVMYNIRIDGGDGCGLAGNASPSPHIEIFSAQPSQDAYVNLFANGVTQTGAKIHASKSVLFNQRIRKVTVQMQRSSGTISGEIKCVIMDLEGNIVEEFPTTVTAASVPTGGDETYDFIHNNNEHKMRAGDSILIEYTEGDTTNHIKVKHAADGDVADGFNTIHIRKIGLTYQTFELEDMAATIYR